VIESLMGVLGVDPPTYDWSFREGRFVGFSGVLAWGREDELTGRVLDDYEQMVSESGDYFETCGELTIARCRGSRGIHRLVRRHAVVVPGDAGASTP
jgi:hypothetical protein